MMVAPMALVTMLLEAIIAMTSLVTLLTKMLAMMLVGMTSSIKCTERNVTVHPIILWTFREFKKH